MSVVMIARVIRISVIGLLIMSWSVLGAESGVQSTVIAEATIASLPAPPVTVRVSGGVLAPGAPAITHSHGMGWVYVIEGRHRLTVNGRTATVEPGQAAWVSDEMIHTHDWDRSEIHRLLFIEMGTRLTPAVLPGFRLLPGIYENQVLNQPLRELRPGPYRVRLSRVTLAPRSQGGVARVLQPEVVIGLAGETSFLTGTGAYSACVYVKVEQVHVIQPPSAYLLRNAMEDPISSLLIQTLIPAQ